MRVGPDGLILVAVGLFFWWVMPTDEFSAQAVRYAGLLLAVAGAASVVIWAALKLCKD